MTLPIENLNAVAMESNRKVFIPNLSHHDFTPAEKYGKLVFASKGTVSPFSIGLITRMWASTLRESQESDYIIPSSLSILSLIGAAMFGHLHGRINLLLFRNNKYIARTIVFKNIIKKEL